MSRVTQWIPFNYYDTTPFPRLLHFNLDMYLTILWLKQGNIKYSFCVFGMTHSEIKSWSPELLSNTLSKTQMDRTEYHLTTRLNKKVHFYAKRDSKNHKILILYFLISWETSVIVWDSTFLWICRWYHLVNLAKM